MPHPVLLDEEKRAQCIAVNTLPGYEVIRYLSTQALLSPKVQYHLAAHRHRSIRSALAAHPSLLSSLQDRLAVEPNQWVRRALAGNPALTHSAAFLLYAGVGGKKPENVHPYIVRVLAGNPATPVGILHDLWEDSPQTHGMIALVLLGNTSFPKSYLPPVKEQNRYQQWSTAKRRDLTPAELREYQAAWIHDSLFARCTSPEIASAMSQLHRDTDLTVGELIERLEEDLAPLSPSEQETLWKLYPDWTQGWNALLHAAHSLTTQW